MTSDQAFQSPVGPSETHYSKNSRGGRKSRQVEKIFHFFCKLELGEMLTVSKSSPFSRMSGVKLHVTFTVHRDLEKFQAEAAKVVQVTKVRGSGLTS